MFTPRSFGKVGVEAYAAYALRAWLTGEPWVSRRTRRFAKWSAISSFGLGMAGQVAYHLLAQAGAARAPWAITTIVSCLPVLVLAMGTTLAHMLRADAVPGDVADAGTSGPAIHRSSDRSSEDPGRSRRDQTTGGWTAAAESGPPAAARKPPRRDHDAAQPATGAASRTDQPQTEQARLIARRLAAAGKPVSRRALRSGGLKGSNESLNALARKVNAEPAGIGPPPPDLNDVDSAHSGMAREDTYAASERQDASKATKVASLASAAGVFVAAFRPAEPDADLEVHAGIHRWRTAAARSAAGVILHFRDCQNASSRRPDRFPGASIVAALPI